MAFYIYEKSSTYIIGKPDRNGVARPDHRQFYKTMSAAKAGLTRIAKAEGLLKTDPNHADYRYAICECDMFHKLVEKKVKKKNMMDPSKEGAGWTCGLTRRIWYFPVGEGRDFPHVDAAVPGSTG